MALLKTRPRMISIRLSVDEYERLKHLCATKGARSLSDVARDAMQRLLMGEPDSGDDQLTARVRELDTRVNILDRQVERVSRLIGADGDGVGK